MQKLEPHWSDRRIGKLIDVFLSLRSNLQEELEDYYHLQPGADRRRCLQNMIQAFDMASAEIDTQKQQAEEEERLEGADYEDFIDAWGHH